MMCNNCGKWAGAYAGFAKDHDLCTCPQKKKWVGLTDDEKLDLMEAHGKNLLRLTNTIKAKLKERNT